MALIFEQRATNGPAEIAPGDKMTIEKFFTFTDTLPDENRWKQTEGRLVSKASPTDRMIVRKPEPFSPDDLAAVHALNQHFAEELSSVAPLRLAELVSHAVYARCIRTPSGERLAGFLIAFDESSDYDGENFRWFKARFDRFVYIDRIAVAPHAHGQGVARKLYADLFNWADLCGHTRLTCEVNIMPPNPGSQKLHAALGFQEIGQATLKGGCKSVSYLLLDVSLMPSPPDTAR